MADPALNLVQVRASLAALRAGVKAFPVVYLDSYYSSGDGGEGNFWYNSADTTSADNGGTIIVDAAGHRYYRSVSSSSGLTPRMFGAKGDGITNDTAAMLAVIAAATNLACPIHGDGLTYVCSSGLTVDISKTDLRDMTLDFTAVSSTGGLVALTLTTSVANGANATPVYHAQHYMSGVWLRGPDGSGPADNTVGWALAPTTSGGQPWINCGVLKNGGVTGFRYAFQPQSGGNGAWGWVFNAWNVAPQDGVGAPGYGLYIQAGANGGEGWKFSQGHIVGTKAACVYIGSGDNDVYFSQTSFDTGLGRVIDMSDTAPTQVNLSECHIEASADTGDYLLYCGTSGNSNISVSHSNIALDAATITHEIGYSALAAGTSPFTMGGVSFESVLFGYSGIYEPDYLVAGPGPARNKRPRFLEGSGLIPTSAQTNILTDPHFSSGTADWKTLTNASRVSGTGPTNFNGTTDSNYLELSLTTSSGAASAYSQFYPVNPGDNPAVQFYMKTSGVTGSGAAWVAVLAYVDVTQAVTLASEPVIGTQTTDTPSWTRLRKSGQGAVAPPGAAFMQLSVYCSQPTSGTVKIDVGAVVLDPYHG